MESYYRILHVVLLQVRNPLDLKRKRVCWVLNASYDFRLKNYTKPLKIKKCGHWSTTAKMRTVQFYVSCVERKPTNT